MQQADVLGGNHAGVDHGGADPVNQTRPVVSAHEHEREGTNLPGLDQGRGFEELVHGAETARHDDETLRVLHEHGLAGEEVAEVDAAVDPLVHALLVRQFDTQAHGRAAGLPRAAVRRLHHARAAARDDRVAALDQQLADAPSALVEGVVGAGASRPEDGDRGANLGEGLEAFDELRLDAQDTPGVCFQSALCSVWRRDASAVRRGIWSPRRTREPRR